MQNAEAEHFGTGKIYQNPMLRWCDNIFAEGCMVAGAGTGIDVPTVGNPDRNPHAVWTGTGFCD